MGQEYSSLSMEERTQLVLLQAQKLSQREIARQMECSASTISRGLARDRPRKILDFRTPREVHAEIVQAKLAERQALKAQTVAQTG
ncbi:helix-turn-helix domain-containing protein [Sphaerotilus sp.]|uniref:helix-turn-helix domain-containing protein n=1 Tax=Sphaerotilus sp. TaxID=2093942 RepID=UPI0025D0B0B7|nr:helix-turn-helix domain-containing protein [Sphaerotilus sp.]